MNINDEIITSDVPDGVTPDGGMVPVKIKEKIGKTEIDNAYGILQKYKAGKYNLEQRIISDEEWYKLNHWKEIRKDKDKDAYKNAPASAWLYNVLANKHADAMDNIPEANVLPREESDKQAAEMLQSIIPVILDNCKYEKTYSNTWWYKLKGGTGVYGVFWDPTKTALGDIDIRRADILSLFWEPGIEDIQDSANLFYVELVDNENLEQNYPQLAGKLGGGQDIVSKYIYDDTVDTSGKSAVFNWYYKKYAGGKSILHFCIFCAGTVLYASENDERYTERGFYDHGKYPFVFDVLNPEAGTPAGFGEIDKLKDTQAEIDALNACILDNAKISAKPRYFVKDSGNVKEEDFADFTKSFVPFTGSGDPRESIMSITPPVLPSITESVLQQKINELKETAGNKDIAQGNAGSGVTAASAIAALMEAGSKLSRDMIKASYRSFEEICELIIELIRQFYDVPRCFRITGNGGTPEYVTFSNAGIVAQSQGYAAGTPLGDRIPVFDLKVKAQKQSPFATAQQNATATQLYQMGMFAPQNADMAILALDMMTFEGKDSLVNKIRQNGTLLQQVQAMQDREIKMAQLIDAKYHTNWVALLTAEFHGGNAPAAGSSAGSETETNSLGEARKPGHGNTMAEDAAKRAANTANPD